MNVIIVYIAFIPIPTIRNSLGRHNNNNTNHTIQHIIHGRSHYPVTTHTSGTYQSSLQRQGTLPREQQHRRPTLAHHRLLYLSCPPRKAVTPWLRGYCNLWVSPRLLLTTPPRRVAANLPRRRGNWSLVCQAAEVERREGERGVGFNSYLVAVATPTVPLALTHRRHASWWSMARRASAALSMRPTRRHPCPAPLSSNSR